MQAWDYTLGAWRRAGTHIRRTWPRSFVPHPLYTPHPRAEYHPPVGAGINDTPLTSAPEGQLLTAVPLLPQQKHPRQRETSPSLAHLSAPPCERATFHGNPTHILQGLSAMPPRGHHSAKYVCHMCIQPPGRRTSPAESAPSSLFSRDAFSCFPLLSRRRLAAPPRRQRQIIEQLPSSGIHGGLLLPHPIPHPVRRDLIAPFLSLVRESISGFFIEKGLASFTRFKGTVSSGT